MYDVSVWSLKLEIGFLPLFLRSFAALCCFLGYLGLVFRHLVLNNELERMRTEAAFTQFKSLISRFFLVRLRSITKTLPACKSLSQIRTHHFLIISHNHCHLCSLNTIKHNSLIKILITGTLILYSFTPVFLNRRAAARYRALASIIPGRERFSWNLSF